MQAAPKLDSVNHSTSARNKLWVPVFHSEGLKRDIFISFNTVTFLASSSESFLLIKTSSWSLHKNKPLLRQRQKSIQVCGFTYPVCFHLAAPKTFSSQVCLLSFLIGPLVSAWSQFDFRSAVFKSNEIEQQHWEN